MIDVDMERSKWCEVVRVSVVPDAAECITNSVEDRLLDSVEERLVEKDRGGGKKDCWG